MPYTTLTQKEIQEIKSLDPSDGIKNFLDKYKISHGRLFKIWEKSQPKDDVEFLVKKMYRLVFNFIFVEDSVKTKTSLIDIMKRIKRKMKHDKRYDTTLMPTIKILSMLVYLKDRK